MTHRHANYDWERLRDVPVRDLISYYWPNSRRPEHDGIGECPICGKAKTDHCKFVVPGAGSSGGNRLRCWVTGTSWDAVDIVANMEGISRADAAAQLSQRHNIPLRGDAMRHSGRQSGVRASAGDAPKDDRPQKHLSTWRQAAVEIENADAANAVEAFMHARGFSRPFVRSLIARGLLRYLPQKSVKLAGDKRIVSVPVLTYPWWRLSQPSDVHSFGDAQQPDALWHRLLDGLRSVNAEGREKLDKDRNESSTAGCAFSLMSGPTLATKDELIVAEGTIKGLAIAAAIEAYEVKHGKFAATKRFGYRGWLALTGLGGTIALPRMLECLLAHRRKNDRPRIRLALDNDKEGQLAARKVYRELVVQGYDVVLCYPKQDGRKDWDEVLAKDGWSDITDALGGELGEPVLREGVRSMSPHTFRVRKSALWATPPKRESNDPDNPAPDPVPELVSDFAPRFVRRFILFDWTSERPRRQCYEVLFRQRNAAGIHRAYMSEEAYNAPDRWLRFGAIHKPALFRRFASEAKEHDDGSQRTVHAIGIVPQVGNPGRFELVGGPQFAQFNGAWTNSIDPVYAGVADWWGSWAGTTDDTEAREHGRQIIDALRDMFARPVASMMAYWVAGCLLKPILSEWPHAEVVAQAGTGKSTMVTKLIEAFGLESVQTDQWSSPYRRFQALGNCVLPIISDEISRIPFMHRPGVQGMLNQAFNPGTKTLTYGQDQYPVTLLGSVLMLGQDSIADEAMASKQVAVRLELSDKVGGRLPGNLPRWPWRLWAEHLCQAMTPGNWARHFEAVGPRVEDVVSANIGSRQRFVSCWQHLLAARSIVRDWLDIGEDSDELDGLCELAQVQASGAEQEGKESLAILQAYAAIVSQNPFAFPYKVDEPMRGVDHDPRHHGVWVVPEQIMATLKERHHTFAITSSRSFTAALIAEGMLGDGEASGYWRDGCCERRQVTFTINGRNSRQWARLIPCDVVERYGLNFPITDGD